MYLRRVGAIGGAALLAIASAGAPPALAKGPAAPKPPPAGTIAGTARDVGGYLLANVEVTVTWQGAKTPVKAVSDAKGAFTVKGVPSGDAIVLLEGKGRVPDEQRVVMPKDKGLLLDVTLRGGILFAGRVVDKRGLPIAGARIEPVAQREIDKVRAAVRLSSSDKKPIASVLDGTFAVDDLIVGSKYVLEFTHPHFAKASLPEMLVEAGKVRDDLVVAMEDAAWVSGRVVDAAGNPVPKARIRRIEKDGKAADEPIEVERIVNGVAEPAKVTGNVSDDQGQFVVGGIEGSAGAALFSADGFLDANAAWTGLVPGQEKPGVKVAMEPATASIEGRVMGPDGKPVAKARVEAAGDAGTTPPATSDARGNFRVAHVKSRGPVVLSVTAEGFASASVENVTLDAKGVAVTMQPFAKLHLKVVDENGDPFDEVTLAYWVGAEKWADSKNRRTAVTLPQTKDGFDVSIALGEVRVRVAAPGHESQTLGPFTATAGQPIDGGTVKLPRKTR